MLKRTKSNRSQRTSRRNSVHGGNSGKLAQHQQRLEVVEDKRCSDDDSSQSSATAAPTFASVHRPRHVGIKRNENNTAVANNVAPTVVTTSNSGASAATMKTGVCGTAMQRPNYQQYQQQRKIQFQQQQQKQMQLQQSYQIANAGNVQINAQQHKFQKSKGSTYELQFNQQQQHSNVQQQQQQQQQQHEVNYTQYLQAGISNTNSVSNRLSMGQLQQPQHSNKTRIPIQHQKMTPPHQQHAAFNHISKNATNLLNDIYERNLLSHTTFQDSERQQNHQFISNQQQYLLQHKTLNRAQIPLPNNFQNSGQIWLHKNPKTQIHLMKLPPTPVQATGLPQTNTTAYPQQYQLSDSYVDPVDTKKHFLFEAQNHQPPPPPAPFNHVYETIKERPAMPPPPPDRNQNLNNPPPLPPSRLLKKKLMAAAANNQATSISKNHKSHKKSSHDKEPDKKANNKLSHTQPPAYVAPPPLLANNGSHKTPAQYPYNLQQRTKADGEHRIILNQQLREQNQKQQQQQQNKTPAQTEVNENLQQQHAGVSGLNKNIATKQQHMQHSQQLLQNAREHPLGAYDEKNMQITVTSMQHNNNTHNRIATSNTGAATSNNEVAMMLETLEEHDTSLSVEHTLQQAGLLPSTSSLANNKNSSISGNNNNITISNNRNNRPSALPIVLEEDTGEFQDVLVLDADGTAQLPYRHGKKIEVSLETAQAMAAAAYYAR